jgi:hypothetical protein
VTKYVCKPAPSGGFVALNQSLKWTPVLSFAHPFDAAYAEHLARIHPRAYAVEFLTEQEFNEAKGASCS